MKRTCKRLLALILALAILAGTGSPSIGGNVYAAEVTGQTISGNELTNEPLEETTEEAVTEEAAEEVTEEAVEETVADEEEEADDTLSGNETDATLSGNETASTIKTENKGENTGGGYKIPGYTQITGDTPLNPERYYLIVSRDSNGTPYALYGNDLGLTKRTNGDGDIYTEADKKGMATAQLTISGNNIEATWLNNGTSVSVNDLHLTVNEVGDGYSFRSADGHYLGMNWYLFENNAVKIQVQTKGEGYRLSHQARYLYFNVQQDALTADKFKNHQTDFWAHYAPNGEMSNYTIWLYEKNGVTVTVDFTELEEMLDQAKDEYPENEDEVNAVKYTSNSWYSFKMARSAAQAAVDGKESAALTQEEVETLEWNLRNSMDALTLRPIYTEPKKYKYIRSTTEELEVGAKYVIYTHHPYGDSNSRDLVLAAYGSIFHDLGLAEGLSRLVRFEDDQKNEIFLDNSTVDEENLLWEVVSYEDGIALKGSYQGEERYISLARNHQYYVVLSSTPAKVTVNYDRQGRYYEIGNATGTLWVSRITSPDNRNWLSTRPKGGGNGWNDLILYKQTEVEDQPQPDIADRIPPTGTTQDQPFTDAIVGNQGGSQYFESPTLTTFGTGNNKLAAAATVKWNSNNKSGGTDVAVSVSPDNGQTWNYKTPLYFNDSVDAYAAQASSFSDPILAADGEKLYLLANLFPGGERSSQQTSGYMEIKGKQRLVLYYAASANRQTNSGYDYYVGDFDQVFDDKTYAPVYEYLGGEQYAEVADFYVDKQYNLYEAVVDAAPKPMYSKQLGSNSGTRKWVQQNVFFFNSFLHVRCTGYLVLTTSNNGGKDWSDFTILNPMVKNNTEAFYYTAAGGQGITMGNLLIFPCYSEGNALGGKRASFIYSDDRGETWHRGPHATTDTVSGESSVVKLSEDTLRMFVGTGNAWLEYVDYTWDGQEWNVSAVTALKDVVISHSLLHSAITYEYQGKTMLMVSAPRSPLPYWGRLKDGKIYTFEVGDDAAKTMTLVDEYDVNPEMNTSNTNDFFQRSAIVGLPSDGTNGSVAVLYESEGQNNDKPVKITYDQILMEDILGNSDFQTKATGTIEGKVYDGKKVVLEELVKGLSTEKAPQDRTGDITWEVYTDEACRNKLTDMPKDAGTYWVRARVEADSKYKVNRSNAIPFTIEQRPLTISYVVVSDEEGRSLSGNSLSGNSLSGNTLIAHGTLDVYFDGLAKDEGTGLPEALLIDQDYTAALAYNHEDMNVANELQVTVVLKNSALGKNYVLTSPTYTFEAEGYENIWLSSVWSKEY
ncbi:MAG: sialidase family protein, partial [Lachnospiraceae bacterium]